MVKDYESTVLMTQRLNKGTPTGIKEVPTSTISDSIRKMKARQKAAKVRSGQSNKLITTKAEQLAKANPVTPWPPR